MRSERGPVGRFGRLSMVLLWRELAPLISIPFVRVEGRLEAGSASMGETRQSNAVLKPRSEEDWLRTFGGMM